MQHMIQTEGGRRISPWYLTAICAGWTVFLYARVGLVLFEPFIAIPLSICAGGICGIVSARQYILHAHLRTLDCLVDAMMHGIRTESSRVGKVKFGTLCKSSRDNVEKGLDRV